MTTGTCQRCGRQGEGRTKWMVHRFAESFPESPVAEEFFCNRCLRMMRIYATIGFSLLAVLVGALAGVTFWLRLGL